MVTQNAKTQIHFSRPKDRSLKAYKDWIDKITQAVGITGEDDSTEEEIKADWQEFWDKFDKAKK